MKNEKINHIGEVTKRLNISQRTVRYYEELGLVSAERSTGGYRVFSETQVERLKTILALKELGLPLDEIRNLLRMRQHGTSGSEFAPKLLEYLKAKLGDLRTSVEKYNSWIKELESVINIIENCKGCHNMAEEASCGRCLEDKTGHHVPALMKTLL